MKQTNKSNWLIQDPDQILQLTKNELEFIEERKFECQKIIPREDLIQLENQVNGLVIDLGFYGCEIELKGNYIVHLLESQNSWEKPIFKESYKSLSKALETLKLLKQKHENGKS